MTNWDERYGRGEHASSEPHKLLVRAVKNLTRGRALDIACGAGRHALFLASQGWDVDAVDSSRVGIKILSDRASESGVLLHARIADLEEDEFQIEQDAYDLICVFYYLQRGLFPKLNAGLRAGGTLVAVIHMVDDTPDVKPMNPDYLLRPDELRELFRGWEILHYHETTHNDTDAGIHTRRSAEIVVRKL